LSSRIAARLTIATRLSIVALVVVACQTARHDDTDTAADAAREVSGVPIEHAPEAVWPPPFWFDSLATRPSSAAAEHAMVSTANPWATNAALEVLRRGGSAIDAAAAAQFVLNVVEPQSSGIGGGCFLLYLPAGAETPVVIDGRETAPAEATEALFLDESGVPVSYYPDRVTGGRPVGVPGTLAAIELAHRRYGRLPFSELFEPAIRLAREGFPVSKRLANALREEQERLALFEATRGVFFRADGATRREGEMLRQPDLAGTFRLIAERGTSVFYRGDIAGDIVRAVRQAEVNPGFLSARDLERYQARVREPVHGRYRGADVFGVGPPSSGGTTVIETLNILDGFDIGAHPPGSADALHIILEAEKIAYADRNYHIGDTDFVQVPLSLLCSREFADLRRKEISLERAADWPVAAKGQVERRYESGNEADGGNEEGRSDDRDESRDESQETSHLTIVDTDGNWLAMTTTIEQVFGSAMIVPGRGFLLNNELTDFSAEPTDTLGNPIANRVEPGKRPRSSMSPTILVRAGRPFLALGSPGGSRIIGIVLNVIVNVVDWKMDVQDAISFPRVYNRGLPWSEPEHLYFHDEKLERCGGVAGALTRLAEMGHELSEPSVGYRAVGGVHAVHAGSDDRLYGGADPRREGVALGF